jgi:hypothetical protein
MKGINSFMRYACEDDKSELFIQGYGMGICSGRNRIGEVMRLTTVDVRYRYQKGGLFLSSSCSNFSSELIYL